MDVSVDSNGWPFCPECYTLAVTYSPILKGFICAYGHHFRISPEPAKPADEIPVGAHPAGNLLPLGNGTRRYLPTLADLIDRLTIAQQKAVFLHERRDEYKLEMIDLMHDIDVIIEGLAKQGNFIGAKEIRAIAVIQLANRVVWENETKIRDGESNEPDEIQFKRLRFTHSVNGVRNTAKNVLSECVGGRKDYKIDCLAADLVEEFGNWDIFGTKE